MQTEKDNRQTQRPTTKITLTQLILSWDRWLLLVRPPYLMKLFSEPVMCVSFASNLRGTWVKS